jgi:hypothetical protein
MRVQDEASDLVSLVGDDGFVEEALERQVGEDELGGDSLLRDGGANARELIAGARWSSAGEEFGERRKSVADAGDGVRVGHCG